MSKKLFKIIFKNEDFLVIDKPAGMLSIPDRYQPQLPAASTLLKKKYGEIFTVHRLDKDTSGLMLFAKNSDTHRALNDTFSEGKVKKEYLALVSGNMPNDEGTIDMPLTFNKEKQKVTTHKNGKASLTTFTVIERFKLATYIRVKMHTGRMHQVRVHLQSIFHPLLVDEKYGSRNAFYLTEIKRKKFNLKRDSMERPLLSRHPLHCDTISFEFNKQAYKFDLEDVLPKDMKATINQLRKLNKVSDSIF